MAAMTSSSRLAETPPAFLGRDQEFAEIKAAVQTARLGRGQTRIIEGQPGIGKTRLVEEVAAWAGEHDIRVFWGRSYEGEGAPAFWPWREILQGMANEQDIHELRQALGNATVDLGTIVPLLADSTARDDGQIDSPDLRFRLFESVTRFLALIARDAPIVLVFEDLHAADPSSLHLLEFAARALRLIPSTLIATTRPALGANATSVRNTLQEVAREPHAQRLTLAALSEEAVLEWIRLALGASPPSALVGALCRQSEGNPLFLREYLRLLSSTRQEGEAWDGKNLDHLPVPETVQSVISQRLGLLTPACQRFLAVASVYGREFDSAEVRKSMRPQVDGEASVVSLDPLVAEAVAARILTPAWQRTDHYRFSHTLMRDILYAGIDPSRRLGVHRHIATTLAAKGGDEDWGLLAFHCLQAARSTALSEIEARRETLRAVQYLRRAARHSMFLRAYEEAVRLYRQALDNCESNDDDEDLCETRIELGRALNAAGDNEASKQVLSIAADQALHLNHPAFLANVALEYGTKFVWGEGPQPDGRLVEILESALRLQPPESHATKARLMARLAAALRFSDRDEERETMAVQALAMARTHGDPQVLLDALHSCHATGWRPNNLEERLAISSEMVRVANESGNLEGLLKAHAWRFDDFLERGERSAVHAEAELCRRIAEEMRQPFYRLLAAGMLVALRTLQGDHEEADARLAEMAAGVAGYEPRGHALITGWMFGLSTTRGSRAALEMLALPLDLLVGQFPGWVGYHSARAYVGHELGDIEGASSALPELYAQLPRSHTAWFMVASHLAVICASAQDEALASRLIEDLLPYEDRAVIIVSGGGYFGSVAHFLALLETVLGDWANAQRHFAIATAMNHHLQAHPWMARTQLEQARMLFARDADGDGETALALLEDAGATADRLGMDILRERIDTLRKRATSAHEDTTSPYTQAEEKAGNVLELEGDTWAIDYAGKRVRLKDSRGMRYIAVLLAYPHTGIPALDLVALADRAPTAAGDEFLRPGMSWRTIGAAPAEPMLDEKARRTIEKRIATLQAQIHARSGVDDSEEARTWRAELKGLETHLAAVVGLGGRSRRIIDEAERARIAVTKRIKDSIKRVRLYHPELGHYLARTIRTGNICTHCPDPNDQAWVVRQAGFSPTAPDSV